MVFDTGRYAGPSGQSIVGKIEFSHEIGVHFLKNLNCLIFMYIHLKKKALKIEKFVTKIHSVVYITKSFFKYNLNY